MKTYKFVLWSHDFERRRFMFFSFYDETDAMKMFKQLQISGQDPKYYEEVLDTTSNTGYYREDREKDKI